MFEEKVRSFIAAEINDEKVINEILDFQKRILDTDVDIKIVEAENIHITLRFLGEIQKSVLERVCEELRDITFRPFKVELKKVGVFPNLSRINVIWIGIHQGMGELTRIFAQLEPKLEKMGFQADDRGFNPHLTIARVKSGRNKDKLAKLITEFNNREFGTIEVESIKLKKSILSPKGPIYSTICEALATKS